MTKQNEQVQHTLEDHVELCAERHAAIDGKLDDIAKSTVEQDTKLDLLIELVKSNTVRLGTVETAKEAGAHAGKMAGAKISGYVVAAATAIVGLYEGLKAAGLIS